ncbi:ubiquitin-like-specific protease ESD4 isoform X3 [Oryza glaberrima]|uniref:ubiquitin-like-specific protease ESD4 isoform X3 n=1 Tax=Oryza glaberrima TaxID=4538 RepID=UPI00224C601F|nr:ubiquitin-like-specific protease ESD4 isoform X3 [Oryza glaberrima]
MSPSATSPPNRPHRKRRAGAGGCGADDGSTRRRGRSAVLLGPTHFPAVRSFGLRLALVVAPAPRHRRKQRPLHYACRPTSLPCRRRRRLRSIISLLHLPILRPFYLRYILAAAASGPCRCRRKESLVGMGNYISRVLRKSSSDRGKAPPADDTAKQDLCEVFTPLTNEEESEVNNILYGSDQSKKIIVMHGPSNIDITKEKIWCLRTCNWLNDEVINLYLELLKERAQREPKRFLKCHFFNTFFYKKARYIRDELNDKSNIQVDTSSWLKISSDSCPLQQNGWDCGMFMLKFIDFHSRGIGLCFTQEHMDYFRKRTAKEILRLRAD